MRTVSSPCAPVIIKKTINLRKSTTSLQQKVLGSWWVVQHSAAENDKLRLVVSLHPLIRLIGFAVALAGHCGTSLSLASVSSSPPSIVLVFPGVKRLGSGDKSDLGCPWNTPFFTENDFFSLGLAEINMIFKVWLESNYVQYFSLVTPDQRNVNCLSTQIPFRARAHRYTPGGLCFPQVICLHTFRPSIRWWDPWNQGFSPLSPKALSCKWWNFIKNWHIKIIRPPYLIDWLVG